MKLGILAAALFLLSCGSGDPQPPEAPQPAPAPPPAEAPAPPAAPSVHANERFRNVRVEKTGESRYRVTGQAQVFEAAFSWVVEDGHNELIEGHAMADAGAPAWGAFRFEVTAVKQRPASTLHLILFEASARDGSRQHTLSIPLP